MSAWEVLLEAGPGGAGPGAQPGLQPGGGLARLSLVGACGQFAPQLLSLLIESHRIPQSLDQVSEGVVFGRSRDPYWDLGGAVSSQGEPEDPCKRVCVGSEEVSK